MKNLRPNDRVRIKSGGEFNGKTGRILRVMPNGDYDVRIDGDDKFVFYEHEVSKA